MWWRTNVVGDLAILALAQGRRPEYHLVLQTVMATTFGRRDSTAFRAQPHARLPRPSEFVIPVIPHRDPGPLRILKTKFERFFVR